MSTLRNKLLNKEFLHMLQESGLCATIGCFYCGAPTCPDDVAVLGGRMQYNECIVYIVKGCCCDHRYCIYPTKSKEVSLDKDDKESRCGKVFGNEYFSNAQRTVHLGIHSRPTADLMTCRKYNWEGVLCTARWELVSIWWFLSGSCGVCQSMEDLYVSPCHLRSGSSGLHSDLLSFERLQRDMLRKIQPLPKSCLLGVRPMEH